jgi:pimeloyl-ACP methyl ester carboxylesterase
MTVGEIGTLDVPGARLHYKVWGSGPLLLMLQGGDGDAEGTDAIADQLDDCYTVVSYDRRGLSRSPVDDSTRTPGIATHTDDAHRLLAALTSEPAFVFGTSLGALIGLDLVARHPEQVRLLVAHEPPATELLPEAERQAAVDAQQEVEEIFHREGVGAAMRRFIAMTGLDFTDREPHIELPQPKPERIANLQFFLTHDAPAARSYRLDLPALQTASAHVVAAAGSASRSDIGAERCARALAKLLGTGLVEFPGGHSGFLLRPNAFATRLREILAAASTDDARVGRSAPEGPHH